MKKHRLSLRLRRYLSASEFCSQLKQLKAYSGVFSDDHLLDWFEETGLICPVVRLAWPELIARRFWHEGHVLAGEMREPVEPDGPRLAAAVELKRALSRVRLRGAYIDEPHPFDDPDVEWTQFLQREEALTFVPRSERQYSVGNLRDPMLYDRNHVLDYFAAWQVLAAAEIAGMGIFVRLNMTDKAVANAAHAALRDGRRPDGPAFEVLAPTRALRGLRTHRAALDAATWSAEEGEVAFLRAARGHSGGRIRLNEAEAAGYLRDHIAAARTAMVRNCVNTDAMLALCAFLAERWEEWEMEGRPLIAEAYRIHLAAAVRLLQLAEDQSFDEIAIRVGPQDSRGKPLLRRVWPDWVEAQRERVFSTLQSSLPASGRWSVTAAELDAFTDFLASEHQDAFFLHLKAFEIHAFDPDSPSPMSGMTSALQGMTVAVEHAIRAMGGRGDQLYKMFVKLWERTPVEKHLTRNNRLARAGTLMTEWPETKARIAEVAGLDEAGAVAADLLMAHRLRGSVHNPVPEDDKWELERLFVQVMRAAAVTHAHLARQRSLEKGAVSVAAAAATPTE